MNKFYFKKIKYIAGQTINILEKTTHANFFTDQYPTVSMQFSVILVQSTVY